MATEKEGKREEDKAQTVTYGARTRLDWWPFLPRSQLPRKTGVRPQAGELEPDPGPTRFTRVASPAGLDERRAKFVV